MIHARLNPITGYLYEISYRPATFPDDVPIAVSPAGTTGPWTYDAVNQLAVELTPAEKLALEDAASPERTELRQNAQTAIDAIDTYLAIATPTAAEMREQVELLSRITRKVIRRLVQLD